MVDHSGPCTCHEFSVECVEFEIPIDQMGEMPRAKLYIGIWRYLG